MKERSSPGDNRNQLAVKCINMKDPETHDVILLAEKAYECIVKCVWKYPEALCRRDEMS